MPDFSHLRKHQVASGRTAPFVLRRLEGAPSLMMLPAFQTTPGYGEFAEREAKTDAEIAAMTPEERAARNRGVTIRVLAECCIAGWKGIVDAVGAEVPWSKENAREFLEALPIDMVTEASVFAHNLDNFRVGKLDAESVAKNS